jgi:ADP-ribose pyrophosphatase
MSDSQESEDKPDLMYQCRIFKVYEGDVRLPDGRTSRFSWIDHHPCICVVPVTDAGEFILIRQYRHATRQILTEIPAGAMNPAHESVEACVQRELAEEIGFQAKRLVKLFEGYLVPGSSNEYMHFFLALDLVPLSLPPDEDEFIETMKVPIAEAESMIRTHQIVDAKTALGISLAVSWLQRHALP